MKLTDDIRYIGVNDHISDLFEGQYIIPNGMAYNSYVILDEKTAVTDTTEAKFTDAWLQNLAGALEENMPDYLIVHHMEPDHSAAIREFMGAYPEAVIIASFPAFSMMRNFCGTDYPDRRIVVRDGDKLNLGMHTLTFFTAPMVHWPEVIMSYDSADGVLFSADAFGKFGALDIPDDDWACEARRYYFGIVGKYGDCVQPLLKKLSGLDIRTVCPLHGPALTENLNYYINLYDTWSSYCPESTGTVIAYTSVYGGTKAAAELLAEKLREKDCGDVVVDDLSRMDMAEAVEDAFRYGNLVLATTTYNAGIFPVMDTFIRQLTERGYKNRKVGLIENGSWAPCAAKLMREMFCDCNNICFAEPVVSITSVLNEKSRAQIDALAEELTRKEKCC